MATFRDLLSAAKSQVTEVDTSGAAALIAAGAVVLDVREPDEYDEGALEGAIHIPRGHLETQVETRIIDRNSPVVVYCAAGVRSVVAATLKFGNACTAVSIILRNPSVSIRVRCSSAPSTVVESWTWDAARASTRCSPPGRSVRPAGPSEST